MQAYITTCCKEKSKVLGEIPILERYISKRIDDIYVKSKEDNTSFFVLSGKYGLLSPSTKIPWYDQILEESEIESMSTKIRHQLLVYGINKVSLFINPEWKNYQKALQIACNKSKIELRIIPNNYID